MADSQLCEVCAGWKPDHRLRDDGFVNNFGLFGQSIAFRHHDAGKILVQCCKVQSRRRNKHTGDTEINIPVPDQAKTLRVIDFRNVEDVVWKSLSYRLKGRYDKKGRIGRGACDPQDLFRPLAKRGQLIEDGPRCLTGTGERQEAMRRRRGTAAAPSLSRFSNSIPNCSSNCLTCCETAGCVSPSSWAAIEKEQCSATASRLRTRRTDSSSRLDPVISIFHPS